MTNMGENQMLKNIQFTCKLFQEDDVVVSVCPEFNVSSFGETPEEAVASLHEAMALFLTECQRMGTLEIVLEEAGGCWIYSTRSQSALFGVCHSFDRLRTASERVCP